MKKFSFLFILLFVASLIFAEKMELSIRYLGLPVVKVLITDIDSRITVQADATKIASIAASMNNDYISLYSENYLPYAYRKIIDQKDYREDRLTNYDRSKLQAHRISYLVSDQNLDYSIKPESRDFFSSLFYLRKACDQKEGELWLDANGLIWKAKYKVIGKEILNTEIGKIEAIKVELTFEKISEQETKNTDMLTNNLVNEDRSLLFWFSADERRIPLKAKFVMKPFPVTWKLEKYE